MEQGSFLAPDGQVVRAKVPAAPAFQAEPAAESAAFREAAAPVGEPAGFLAAGGPAEQADSLEAPVAAKE